MREAKVVHIDIGGGPGREILAYRIGDWYAGPIPRFGWCVGSHSGRAFWSPDGAPINLTWEHALELAGRLHEATGIVGADYDRAQVDAVIRQWRKERGL